MVCRWHEPYLTFIKRIFIAYKGPTYFHWGVSFAHPSITVHSVSHDEGGYGTFTKLVLAFAFRLVWTGN